MTDCSSLPMIGCTRVREQAWPYSSQRFEIMMDPMPVNLSHSFKIRRNGELRHLHVCSPWVVDHRNELALPEAGTFRLDSK